MNIDEIRKYCLDFAGATERVQWGDDLCFKVGGKIFAIVGLAAVPTKLCFKCNPETFAELIERDGVRPAPYVGRFKWVLLDRLDALNNRELEDLVRQSYEMVAAKAPKGRPSKRKSASSTRKRSAGPRSAHRPGRRRRTR
ncbi:MAG TPA: MmcQ/YjbR family DNA-binding protein [Candidatus Sulfotelmatobacter sp.]|nr:MmcQ/YjbR family DNA-binding protein [Candidatus Sulfotelmatobacter sp.]